MYVGFIASGCAGRSVRAMVEDPQLRQYLEKSRRNGLLALLAPEVILMEAFGDWVHSCEGLKKAKGKQN